MPAISELARTPAEEEHVENSRWWLLIVVAIALLGGVGYLVWQWRAAQRRRQAEEEAARRPQVNVGGAIGGPAPAAAETQPGGDVPTFWTPSRPVTAPPVVDAPVPVVAAPPRPRIVFTLHARRSGINLVSATADIEVTVRNEGDGEAEAVAVAAHLLAGRAGQDDEFGALFAADQGKPALPPFALAPGAERLVRTTLVLPRTAIEPIDVAGRPMFVPVVAVDVRYARPDGGTGQIASAFVVGAVRPGGEKLAPFWLDSPARMREDVEARPHGLSIES